MKKTISIIVALAMVLMMSFSAFALDGVTTPKPTTPDDVEGWTAYYLEAIEVADITALVAEIQADLESGAITQETLLSVLGGVVTQGGSDALAAVTKILEELGLELPSIELPSELPSEFPSELPSEFPSDITLPSIGGGDSGSGSFIDTILGALGSLGDLIFGGGDDPGDNGGNDAIGGGNNGGDDDDLWGDDSDDPFNDNSLGDTSVIAVSAVAVVACAALVLTRKKKTDNTDDAE